LAVGVVALLGYGYFYTVPAATGYESFFGRIDHNSTFLNVLNGISNSGIPGNILSTTAAVDRWPSAITERNTYEPRYPTGFVYSADQVLQDEMAYWAVNDRYAVSTGLVSASIPGISSGYFNASPIYSMYAYGIPRPVFQLPPQSISLTMASGAVVPVYARGGTLPTYEIPPAGGSAMAVLFSVDGVTVAENISAYPGTDRLSINLTASGNGTVELRALSAQFQSSSQNFDVVNRTATPGGFSWYSLTANGNFTTFGNVTPAAALARVTTANTTTGNGAGFGLSVQSATPSGAPALSVNLSISTPGAQNLTGSLPHFLSSTAIWAAWQVRFCLLLGSSPSSSGLAASYFLAEYGAATYLTSGDWTVLLLPVTPYAATSVAVG